LRQARGFHQVDLLAGKASTTPDSAGLTGSVANRHKELKCTFEPEPGLIYLASDVRHESEVQVRAGLASHIAECFPHRQALLEEPRGGNMIVLDTGHHARRPECRAADWRRHV